MTPDFAGIPLLEVRRGVPLAAYTRFGIGGPAGFLVETRDPGGLASALGIARASGKPVVVMGGGTNLVVADEGFPGIVLRYTADCIQAQGPRVTADAGAALQALVDFTVGHGLRGVETLTRIPGWVGAAVYGNAGAYGHSLSERIARVNFTDGGPPRALTGAECEFHYRESVFKRRREWVILSVELELEQADPAGLRRIADEIAAIRDSKFPPSMKCAGSIFKNLILKDLSKNVAAQVPPEAVREGKVAAGWFLERVEARGMVRGGIHVAEYHGNLIYNAGGGTARELCALMEELKRRVRDRFGLELEEEVQYIGMGEKPA